MSSEFSSYALVTILALVMSLLVVGVGRAKNVTNMIGWYLFVFFLTYVIHPAASEWTKDFWIYDLLDIAPLSQQWFKMTFAVCLSLGCLSLGYYVTGRSTKTGRPEPLAATPAEQKAAFILAVCLCVWGYLALILSGNAGGMNTNSITNDDTGYGIASGSTFWLLNSDLFVSTGATLLYILNRRLLLSLAIALPWLAARLSVGYGRNTMIGHAMALLAVWGMASPGIRKRAIGKRFQLLLLGAGGVFIVVVLFPAIGRDRDFFAGGLSSDTISRAIDIDQTADDISHSTGDLAGFEETLYFLQMDQPVWGTYYLYFYFLKPIPRVIFPEKGNPDTLAAEWFGVERDLRYTGLDSGSIGWAFQQWSWGGIVFEFMLTGFLLRKFEDLRDRSSHRPEILLGYAGFFSLLPLLGRDSVLVMIEERWLFVYGIPCFILWFLMKSARATAARSSVRGFEQRGLMPARSGQTIGRL